MTLASLHLSRAKAATDGSWWSSYQHQRQLRLCSPSHAIRMLRTGSDELHMSKATYQVLVSKCGQGFAWHAAHRHSEMSFFQEIVEAEMSLGYLEKQASSLMNIKYKFISEDTLLHAASKRGTFEVATASTRHVYDVFLADLLPVFIDGYASLRILGVAFSTMASKKENTKNRETWASSIWRPTGCRLHPHQTNSIRRVLHRLPLIAQYYVLSRFDVAISQAYLDHLATCLPPHQHLLLCFRQDHDASLASIAHLRDTLDSSLDTAVSAYQRCELVREVRGRGIAWALFWLLDLWPAAASALECAAPSALCDLLRYDCDSDLDIRLLDHLDQRWDLCRLIAASHRLNDADHHDRPMFHRRTHYGTRTLAWLLDRHPSLMVDQVDGSGSTLLHWTAEHGDAASLLVMAARATEAMRGLRDDQGRTACMLVGERADPSLADTAAMLMPI